MITLEPTPRRHTVISQSEVPALYDRFFRCFDKATIVTLLNRYSKSNAVSRTLDSFGHRTRMVAGIGAACMIHDRLRPPDELQLSFESIFLVKFLTELYEQGNDAERKNLWGVLREVLNKDKDPRQRFFELAVGFIYADFGAKVGFTDLSNESRFEFLVEKEGYKTEVEVKTISSISGLALSSTTLDSFATSVYDLLDKVRFSIPRCHVRILINGKHAKHQPLIDDLRACIRDISGGRLQARRGNIDLSIVEALPGDIEYVEAYSRDRRHQPPEHLKVYPLISLLTPNPDKRFFTISFTESWNIATNLDDNLGDAYKKFSRKLPAVAWICLSDASSFLTNPNARDIGFFQNNRVRHILNKFQTAGRYNYPTGFVVASNFSCLATRHENSELSLQGRYRFFQNKGLAAEHSRFFPYHTGPF